MMLDMDGDGFGTGDLDGGLGLSRVLGMPSAPPKVPVTILCGFLGAGKTTMVRHILRNREGLKVGVVVNDVAETNIDSEILKFEDADGIVGLQNGCVCCSGRDDLFARLEELVQSAGVSKLDRPWDRLVVECSGVAEPESIARELEAMGRRGELVMRRIFLAGITCVVDASTFWESYNSTAVGAPGVLPLSALLVSQLESADTVVINKADLVIEAELRRLEELIAALCPNARRLVTTRGALPLRQLLPAEPVALDLPAYVPTLANRHGAAVSAASRPPPARAGAAARMTAASEEHVGHTEGHGHAHSHEHSHEGDGEDGCAACASEAECHRHARYGLSSFVYRRNGRRFDPAKLAATARQMPVVALDITFAEPIEGTLAPAPSPAFAGLMRSKGFLCIRGNDKAHYWSHAGRRLQISEVEPVLSTRGPTQELVFIGAGLDERAITELLDACLDPESAL